MSFEDFRENIELEYIFAVNETGIIGIGNRLPWHIPEDLVYFRKMTLGNIMIMGLKTFESIPDTVLRGRIPVVLSRSEQPPKHLQDRIAKNSVYYTTIERCFDIVHTILYREKRELLRVFVIGGAEIFRTFYPYVSRLFITNVEYPIAETNSVGDSNECVCLPFTFEELDRDFETIHYSDVFYSRNKYTVQDISRPIPYQFLELVRKE